MLQRCWRTDKLPLPPPKVTQMAWACTIRAREETIFPGLVRRREYSLVSLSARVSTCIFCLPAQIPERSRGIPAHGHVSDSIQVTSIPLHDSFPSEIHEIILLLSIAILVHSLSKLFSNKHLKVLVVQHNFFCICMCMHLHLHATISSCIQCHT